MKVIIITFLLSFFSLQAQEPVKILRGHLDDVNSVAISSDGKYIVSGSDDKTIKLWEISSGREIKTFRGHEALWSVAISPDGKYIVSGGKTRTIDLWEISSGREIKTFRGHGFVRSVAISPDGKYIVSGSSDETIKLWEISSGREIKTFRGHEYGVWSVAISPDGKYIVSGSWDKTIKLWEISSGREIKTFRGHEDFVVSVAISPDGKYIVSGSWDKTIKLWEISSGREIKTFRGHEHYVSSVAISPDGKYIVSGSWDETIKLWEISSGREIKTFRGHEDFVLSVAISPDGKYIVSGSWDKTIRIWDVSNIIKIDPTLVKNYNYDISNKLPPILQIEEIVFSKATVNAGENAKLSIKIKNIGPGDAEDLSVELNSDNPYLEFEKKKSVNKIKSNGGQATVDIEVKANRKINTGTAYIDVNIAEPYFKVKVQGKRVVFNTKEFEKPVLALAKFAVLENLSTSPNNQIDINEIIDLKIAVQNIGQGAAEDLKIQSVVNQKGVIFLGVEENNNIVPKNEVKITRLEPGKYETIVFRYFINSEFTDKKLKFKITCSERYNEYGFVENKIVDVNTTLREEGVIRQIAVEEKSEDKRVIIEDIPDFEIDVRKDIPATKNVNSDAIAVIIGNRDYKRKDIPSVDFAIDDALTMKQYLIKTFGYREENILYYPNAAQSDFISVFGTRENHRGKLFNYVKAGKSDVFIYYSGHGAPDPESRQGYFVPVDCDPSTVALNGYSLNTFYENLSKINYKSLTIVIDACFSGSSERGMLLKNISPVFISVENPIRMKENSVILTSSTGDQVSSWYRDKKHSLFTYYFLKAIKGEADQNRDKQITVKEIKEYINENVPYMARRLHNREQTPQIIGNENKVIVKY